MKIRITRTAAAEIDEIFSYIARHNPRAAEAVVRQIDRTIGRIGKYPQVAEALFRTQASWGPGGKVWESIESALTPAEQKKVQMLAKDPGVVTEVEREYQEGVSAGVNATPTVIVTQGAKRYPIPAQQLHYGFLKSLLDGMLK